MKITEEKRRQIRNYIMKKLSPKKKSSTTTLLDENGEEKTEILNCLIKWVKPMFEELFKNSDIKNDFMQASLNGTRLHKHLIPFAISHGFCDERGFLHTAIAAIVRSYFWSKTPQMNEQEANLYLLNVTQTEYSFLP
jgi:hypothetical protein